MPKQQDNSGSKEKLTYPSDDELTLRWLFENVPVRMWVGFAVLLVSVSGLGFGLGARPLVTSWVFGSNKDGQIDDMLRSEVSALKTTIEEQERAIASLNEQASQAASAHSEEASRMQARIQELEKLKSAADKRTRLLESQTTQLRRDIENETGGPIDATDTGKMVFPQTAQKRQEQGTAATPEVTFSQIVSGLPAMHSPTVDEFLITMIPKINGGVTCQQLAILVAHARVQDRDAVVKFVAHDVRSPINADCIESLSKLMVSTEAAAAIKALLSPDPNLSVPSPIWND